MLFISFQFVFVFLPTALVLYYGLGRLKSDQPAKASLAIMSLVFYAYWDWQSGWETKYIFLLLSSLVVNFTIGTLLARQPSKPLLALGISLNLGAIAYYKYAGFLVANYAAVTGWGIQVPSIVLPLGISFFTFQQIAFLVDAHRGEAEELNPVRYSLFVAFFPQLIAGPIVHHKEMMPQFAKRDVCRWKSSAIYAGLAVFTIGLAKKIVIADTCGPWAGAVFATTSDLSMIEAWSGALAYTMQIYFDFSGYSDMAIGLGMMFGVRIPENFNAPYKAISIIDFWRRWHMTLSRFLRDYLYIPLGGNRRGKSRRYMNLMLTMLLGGLWHGASWTFVIWGGYHGLLLVVVHVWRRFGQPMPMWVARTITFVAVVAGWVVFRATSMGQAGEILKSMCDVSTLRFKDLSLIPGGWWQAGLLGALVVFVNFAPTTRSWTEGRTLRTRHAVLLGALFFLCLLLMRDTHLAKRTSEFIYFQF
ncbi:MAG: MBOAT family protein [Phycisphaerales bacterium]|nr:MBOAT family protein [Phycisphaerales bacterium]